MVLVLPELVRTEQVVSFDAILRFHVINPDMGEVRVYHGEMNHEGLVVVFRIEFPEVFLTVMAAEDNGNAAPGNGPDVQVPFANVSLREKLRQIFLLKVWTPIDQFVQGGAKAIGENHLVFSQHLEHIDFLTGIEAKEGSHHIAEELLAGGLVANDVAV